MSDDWLPAPPLRPVGVIASRPQAAHLLIMPVGDRGAIPFMRSALSAEAGAQP